MSSAGKQHEGASHVNRMAYQFFRGVTFAPGRRGVSVCRSPVTVLSSVVASINEIQACHISRRGDASRDREGRSVGH
jgi:hypothetical protein